MIVHAPAIAATHSLSTPHRYGSKLCVAEHTAPVPPRIVTALYFLYTKTNETKKLSQPIACESFDKTT